MNRLLNLFGSKKGNAERIYELSKLQYLFFIDHANGLIDDIEQAKKIVNEAFAAAYEQQESFNSIEAIVIFLVGNINQNCNACQIERLQMERIKELILNKEREDYQVTREVLQAVQEEVEHLPRPCRQIFQLFFCGLSAHAVAGMVDRKIKTVKNQKGIARELLLDALRKRGILSE